jgi:hypothetical protein
VLLEAQAHAGRGRLAALHLQGGPDGEVGLVGRDPLGQPGGDEDHPGILSRLDPDPVVEGERYEDGLDLVVAVGAAVDQPQTEVELRRSEKGDPAPQSLPSVART